MLKPAQLWPFLLGALLACSAHAGLCPRLLYQMGLISNERGAISPAEQLGGALEGEGSFLSLSRGEYDLLRRLENHCRWLEVRAGIPLFADERNALCKLSSDFSAFRYAWSERSKEMVNIRELRNLGAGFVEVQFHKDRVNSHWNPTLAALIPKLRKHLQILIPRLIYTIRAFDELKVRERAIVVGAFNYLGNCQSREGQFEREMAQRGGFYQAYQVAEAFRDLAIALEAKQTNAWEIVARYGRLPDVDLGLARTTLAARILASQAALDASASTAPTDIVPAPLPAIDIAPVSLEVALPSPTPVLPRLTRERFRNLSMLASRWRWLELRTFTPYRQSEADRLAGFQPLYPKWNELEEHEQAARLALAAASGDDPEGFESAREQMELVNAERADLGNLYWALLGALEEHVAFEDRALSALPDDAKKKIESAHAYLETRHEALAGVPEYDYRRLLEQDMPLRRADRIVRAFDDLVGTIAVYDGDGSRQAAAAQERAKLRVLASFRRESQAPKKSKIELHLVRQTGGNHDHHQVLEKKYYEFAVARGWKWERLTNVGNNSLIRIGIEGVGAEEFFIRETGAHSFRAKNSAGEKGDKERVYSREVEVRVIDDHQVTRSSAQPVRSYNEYGREVIDKRIDPQVVSSHISWSEFMEGDGLGTFYDRLLAVEGIQHLQDSSSEGEF